MAKLKKKSSHRPQPRHNKQQPSQHDKRRRLLTPHPDRPKTLQAQVPLGGAMQAAVAALQAVINVRLAFRLAIIVSGMLLADDRRTASAWFAAAGVQGDWDRFYDCLISIGRQSQKLALVVLTWVVRKFDPGPEGRFLLGLDDSPTSRYGRHVEGAGMHHHPTSGPADGEWLYGHNGVTLALLATHPLWGVIALPLQSLWYVRAVNVPALDTKYGWKFRTPHPLAAELVVWFGVVIGRLRRDAKLFDLPPARPPGPPGRPRVHGEQRISLAKRAAPPQGWQSITDQSRGVEVTRSYKTFLATSRLVGGVIRVVIVRFDDGGWAAYFCPDPTADVRDILEAVAARWALEEHFHDVKEVWGAGQQQVRNVWSNIGCWHLNQWLVTLVERCSWDQEKSMLTDRRDRPWDNAARRPSPAARRRTIAREMPQTQFLAVLPRGPDSHQFRDLVASLLSLCL